MSGAPLARRDLVWDPVGHLMLADRNRSLPNSMESTAEELRHHLKSTNCFSAKKHPCAQRLRTNPSTVPHKIQLFYVLY